MKKKLRPPPHKHQTKDKLTLNSMNRFRKRSQIGKSVHEYERIQKRTEIL
jgi:hypothetical protein